MYEPNSLESAQADYALVPSRSSSTLLFGADESEFHKLLDNMSFERFLPQLTEHPNEQHQHQHQEQPLEEPRISVTNQEAYGSYQLEDPVAPPDYSPRFENSPSFSSPPPSTPMQHQQCVNGMITQPREPLLQPWTYRSRDSPDSPTYRSMDDLYIDTHRALVTPFNLRIESASDPKVWVFAEITSVSQITTPNGTKKPIFFATVANTSRFSKGTKDLFDAYKKTLLSDEKLARWRNSPPRQTMSDADFEAYMSEVKAKVEQHIISTWCTLEWLASITGTRKVRMKFQDQQSFYNQSFTWIPYNQKYFSIGTGNRHECLQVRHADLFPKPRQLDFTKSHDGQLHAWIDVIAATDEWKRILKDRNLSENDEENKAWTELTNDNILCTPFSLDLSANVFKIKELLSTSNAPKPQIIDKFIERNRYVPPTTTFESPAQQQSHHLMIRQSVPRLKTAFARARDKFIREMEEEIEGFAQGAIGGTSGAPPSMPYPSLPNSLWNAGHAYQPPSTPQEVSSPQDASSFPTSSTTSFYYGSQSEIESSNYQQHYYAGGSQMVLSNNNKKRTKKKKRPSSSSSGEGAQFASPPPQGRIDPINIKTWEQFINYIAQDKSNPIVRDEHGDMIWRKGRPPTFWKIIKKMIQRDLSIHGSASVLTQYIRQEWDRSRRDRDTFQWDTIAEYFSQHELFDQVQEHEAISKQSLNSTKFKVDVHDFFHEGSPNFDGAGSQALVPYRGEKTRPLKRARVRK